MSIMSSENKKTARNKSKNRNKNNSQPTVAAVASTNQSVGERLQSAVQTLQRYGSFVDLRNKANHWIKLATQVLSNPVTQPRQVEDASAAALLLLHVLERCGPSSPSDASCKLQLSPQLLLPCARAALLQAGPHDLVNLPCLLMFRQLLSTHPGLCSPIKDQLEQKLKGWLNTAPEAMLEDRLHTGASKLPRCHLATPAINSDDSRVDGDCSDMALAADVWALMPLANSAGAADNDQFQSTASKADGLAAARGKQLKQLLLTLQNTLDGLLGNVVQTQGSETLTNTTGIPLLKFVPVGKKYSAKKVKKVIASDGAEKMEEDELQDNLSDPLEMVEVSFNRCCGLLVFVERLLVSVVKGTNERITLVTRDVLLPLFRILQVSGSALHRYHSAEVQKLAKLWPALQHRALHALHAALLALGPHLFSWYHLILDQLTNTLLAVPNAKTTPPKTSGAAKVSDDSPVKGESEQQFGLEKLGMSWDVVAQQETVRLVYLCLNKLARVSRNMHGTPLPLAKAIFADLSPQPNNDATLQIPSKKSIASMNIKKKSKRKGYTISTSNLPPSITLTNTHRSSLSSTQTSSTENAIENLSQPFSNLSQEKSALIISNALDLLRSTISCDQHYVLSADTATLIVHSIVRLARTYCGVTDVRSCRFYPSVSGLVDLRALLGNQQLMAKLFRLLPLLVVHLHPAFPPPAAELQFTLREGARIHSANEPLSQACEDGLRQIGSFLCNPNTAAFLDNIEKMKISEFNKSGENGGEYAREIDEVEDDSDEEMVADDDQNDNDNDGGSENEEDSAMDMKNHTPDSDDAESVPEANGSVNEEDSAVGDDGNQAAGTDDESGDAATNNVSVTEADSAVDKENETPASDDEDSVTEAPQPPPLKKSAKKRRKTQSEGGEELLKKKKRKVSVSGKIKAKKAKRSSSAAKNLSISGTDAKVVSGAEDDEREEGDLSVADMLSELLD